MNELDNENRILELFRIVPTEKVCILFGDDFSRSVYESLVNTPDNWVDNSGKCNPPPDYLNHKESIMLEMMRVNDTEAASNRRESEMQHELSDSGILNMFPNLKSITCVPDVHSQSYDNYIKSFTSSLTKHNGKIEKYRTNHPGIDHVVFFICDESEAYFEIHEITSKGGRARPHLWFLDERFINAIKGTKADTVIWFTPYKVMERDGFNYPDVTVINPKLIDNSLLTTYESELMFDATKVERVREEE